MSGRSAEASASIEAPLEVVWAVMLDLEAYPAWNPFVVRIEGPLGRPAAVGDELVLHVRWASGRGVTTRERITRLDPPTGGRATLEYEFGGPLAALGLVRGRRSQELEGGPGAPTRYRTAERLHGLLAVAAPIGRVQDGFERHAAALRARAEAVHAGEGVTAAAGTMTALRLEAWGAPPRFADVPVPRPGPGEVLLRMAAVGLCHTDLHFLEAPPGAFPYELPFTLGHENVGRVEEHGAGVDDLAPGTAVAVAGVHSCGRCTMCLRGADNYCPQGWRGRGYGDDGGLATFLVVPRRQLVPLGDLDPCAAAPLTDAGATSYHVVRKVAPRLVPGSTAVVIGAGGLGGYAIQHLRLLTAARVVAVDVDPARREAARSLGADEVLPSDQGTAGAVRALTDGAGAEAVLDFVGSDTTVGTALGCARAMGAVALVGAGGGTAAVGWGRVPLECDVFVPIGATLADLHEVVALAWSGALRMDVEVFPFERAVEAYERFAAGELRARAVVALAT